MKSVTEVNSEFYDGDKLERMADGKTCVLLRDDPQGGDNDLVISRRHLANVRRRLKSA